MNASSTWALSVPVWRHWAMKRGLRALGDHLIVKSEIGIVTSATSASSGEIVNIMIVTPMIVRVDVSSWLSDCWRLCAMLSMSFVTRLSRSPRGWLVDVAQRQRVELVLDVGAQPEHRALHDAGEDVRLEPDQHR